MKEIENKKKGKRRKEEKNRKGRQQPTWAVPEPAAHLPPPNRYPLPLFFFLADEQAPPVSRPSHRLPSTSHARAAVTSPPFSIQVNTRPFLPRAIPINSPQSPHLFPFFPLPIALLGRQNSSPEPAAPGTVFRRFRRAAGLLNLLSGSVLFPLQLRTSLNHLFVFAIFRTMSLTSTGSRRRPQHLQSLPIVVTGRETRSRSHPRTPRITPHLVDPFSDAGDHRRAVSVHALAAEPRCR
jgi:hypothetical protein